MHHQMKHDGVVLRLISVEEMDDPHISTLIFYVIVFILFLKLYLYPIAGDC